ncbi:hypothetical protein [Pseudoalteromonas prydzensis]|uniref:hypothetical protein n=1 Tax=Pseudoalteromonas prydzensis TaxID=182141 RepID=UPI0037045312
MNDGIIWFCCLAILVIGMIFGISLDSSSETLDSLYKVFGIVSGIGALLTVIVAISALRTWKHQFSHAERFKAFKELDRIALDCISNIEQYWGVFKDEYFFLNTPKYYQDHSQAKKEKMDLFWKSKDRYRLNVDYAQSLLSAKEQKEFKYTYGHFDTKVHEIINGITNSYNNLEGEDRHEGLIKVEADVLNLKIDLKESLRKFRGQ